IGGDNQQTPKDDLPPQSLVEVYDLDAIKKEQEEKLKQELIEYATELQKQGKSSEEIEKQSKIKELNGKINNLETNEAQLQTIIKQKEELLQDLQKKK
ncbi:MAG: hypothetical protein ACQBVK_02425, partial [Candidatus Phytoplasma sp. TWB_XP]